MAIVRDMLGASPARRNCLEKSRKHNLLKSAFRDLFDLAKSHYIEIKYNAYMVAVIKNACIPKVISVV